MRITTKQKKVWRSIRIPQEDYLKAQKFAKVRKISLPQLISLLIKK